MGLDVYLYQFKDVDPDAILELARFEEDLHNEEFRKWKAGPESERGQYLTEKDRSETREKVLQKTHDFGLPESVVRTCQYGGTKVSFPSKHPDYPIGEWVCIWTIRNLMQHATGKDIYFVFPEALGDPHWLQPDWAASKQRFSDIVDQIKSMKPEEISRVIPDYSTGLDVRINQMEAMMETLDFVLAQENPKQFLFYWSS